MESVEVSHWNIQMYKKPIFFPQTYGSIFCISRALSNAVVRGRILEEPLYLQNASA